MADGKRAAKSTTEKLGDNLSKVGDGMNQVRAKVAPLIWLVFVVLALFLIGGALLVALGDNVNPGNSAVEFVLNVADSLDLGIFSRQDGIFTFMGENRETKAALVNWGLAAVVYLIVGKVLQRVMEP